jgi:GNAT superfamily N-acetyltransferase
MSVAVRPAVDADRDAIWPLVERFATSYTPREADFAGRPVVWVGEIMVAEDARRMGVGEALMSGAEAWADQLGAAYVSLATRRADSFYLALGYEESARFFRKQLPG